MILLQATATVATTWRTYLQDINQIAQIIGTIMVVIYVIYTYLTFKQIKKQTDYQQDAYLKVETLIVKELTNVDSGSPTIGDGRYSRGEKLLSTKYLQKEVSTKMIEVLKPIFKFDDNLFEGNYFTVNLINYGNTEINLIKLQIQLSINNSKEVAEKKMLREKEVHNISIDISEIVGRNGDKLRIPLISTAAFPIYSINISGQYYDVRNKKYIIQDISANGQNEHFQKVI